MTDDGATNDRFALAAELALGLLDGEERAQALRLRLEDRDFAELVERWESEIGAWVGELPIEENHIDRWDGIERALGSSALDDTLPAHGGSGWKWATLAASVAAITFASLWAMRPSPFRPQRTEVVAAAPQPTSSASTAAAPPVQQAALDLGDVSVGQATAEGDKLLIQGVYDRRSGVLLLRLGEVDGGDRVPEVWLVDGTVPRSLGIYASGEAVKTTLSPADRKALEKGAVIALSLEEPSDKPHDKPAGPILGKLTLSTI